MRRAWILIPVLGAVFAGIGVDDPTYEQDVAPIIAQRCLPCHTEGGPAPFPLQTYEQVHRKAALIRYVTIEGSMPPTDALSDLAQITSNAPITDGDRIVFQEWVRAGAPRGSQSNPHAAPIPRATWTLPKPNATWAGGQGEHIRADGTPFRKLFLIPNPLKTDVALTQFALRPAVPLAWRQAYVSIIPKGFEGDIEKEFFGPIGMKTATLVGAWASGYMSWHNDAGVTVHPGDRVAVWALLQPTGKDEPSDFKFDVATAPLNGPTATWHSFSDDTFSIKPVDGVQTVRQSWKLEKPLAITSIVPECRSYARQIRVKAELPDDTHKLLLMVVSWDANWVGAYQPDRPIKLPAGTTLTAEIDFDNSGHSAGNRESKPTTPVKSGPMAKDDLFLIHVQGHETSRA